MLAALQTFDSLKAKTIGLQRSLILLCIAKCISHWWMTRKGNPIWNQGYISKLKIVSVGGTGVLQLGAAIAFFTTIEGLVNNCYQQPVISNYLANLSNQPKPKNGRVDPLVMFMDGNDNRARLLLMSSIGCAIVKVGPLLFQRVIASKWRYSSPAKTPTVLPISNVDRLDDTENRLHSGPLAEEYDRWQERSSRRVAQRTANSQIIVVTASYPPRIEPEGSIIPSPATLGTQEQLRFHESLLSWTQVDHKSIRILFVSFGILQTTLAILQIIRLIILAQPGARGLNSCGGVHCTLSFLGLVPWIPLLFVIYSFIPRRVPLEQQVVGKVNVFHLLVLGLVIGYIFTIITTHSLIHRQSRLARPYLFLANFHRHHSCSRANQPDLSSSSSRFFCFMRYRYSDDIV
ncbi:hypothetical protein QBC33DRAFT_551957 [Phialemonium atrogriseum]|uniref:Uncharacterized protein n=1 Tax=Phialemonium atrogriseum TaxID=1093897 RepID=A0AAJ0FBH2_9PEZI|nr:uncharacterized protein QBC33DRAFT_551957 [Phialemonium atrogriseum]KAK1762476.1 hypothetical protein QBC33DRAFT_551957 [Phialemonium atrogriseum]